MFNFKMTLGLKISIPIILVTTIFMLAILTINYQRVKRDQEKFLEETIAGKMAQIDNNIKRIENKALWVSSVCSDFSFVKKAYSEFYSTGDLQSSSLIIEKEMLKANKAVSDNLGGTQAKIHYHLPPARSFIRCWSGKRGDDISPFRNTVLKISETHEPVTGIEVGRGGFVIRGLAPIFGDNDQYYGSVETLYPITDMVKTAKIAENEEFGVFMHTSLLNIASDFLEEGSTNVKAGSIVKGDLIFIESTSKKFLTEKLPVDKLEAGLKGITRFQEGNIHYAVFPIFNFNNVAEGVGVIQIDQTVAEEAMARTVTIVIILAVVLPLLLILFVLFFTNIFVSKPIAKAVNVMNRIADKDITENIKETRNDEIGILYNAVNNVSDNFREIVTSLRTTSKSVFDSCLNLSGTAFNISQNSETQSATTEGISSSMEEMLATVESNTKRAEMTGKTASKSAKEIKRNNEIFTQAINSVYEISKKIAIISEIAAKTDILSINAAIEASHAGDTGKGFAVVAQEIRKLADKSRDAATEIENISVESQEISKEAGDKLNSIVPEIIQGAELVDSIAVASRELIISIELINSSVLELVGYSNSNSIVAEELSVTSEELQYQAGELQELISVFKI